MGQVDLDSMFICHRMGKTISSISLTYVEWSLLCSSSSLELWLSFMHYVKVYYIICSCFSRKLELGTFSSLRRCFIFLAEASFFVFE